MYPEHLRYSEDHQWLRDDGEVFVVGITDYAAEMLGKVTCIELPPVGMKVRQGDEIATVDSVNATSDVYAPVGGRVVAVNKTLPERPELVNEDPYAAWLFELEEVRSAELDQLLDAAAYARFVAENA